MTKYAYQFNVINNKLCAVKNKLSKLTYVKDITDLELVGTDLILTYIDEKDVEHTQTVSLAPLGGGGSFVPSIVVDNYNELLTVVGQSLFEFAQVRNNQGNKWLPGSLGGTFYGAGLYYWDGVEWINDNDQIFEALQQIIVVNIAQQAQIDALVYGTQLNLFESNAVSINNTTVLADKINQNTTALPVGKYKIRVTYSWNHNATNSDFESYLFFDGNPMGQDVTGLIHKKEPKDAAGNWMGTGTSQKEPFAKDFYVDVIAAGVKNVTLQFRTDAAGRNSSIWDTNIEIIRIS